MPTTANRGNAPGVRPTERRENRPERTRTLQVRLSLLVVAITSPALVLFGFLSLYTAQQAVQRELDDRVKRAGAWLDEIFARADITNPPTIEFEIDRLKGPKSIYRDVVVFAPDEAGELTSVGSPPPGTVKIYATEADKLAFKEDRVVMRRGETSVEVSSPIRSPEKRVIGLVHSEVFLRERSNELATDAPLYLAIVALGALGLTGLALVFALDRAIGRPVERLVEVMDSARQGDLNAQIEVVQMDEFGWLGENFNRMLRKLKENDESLRELMAQAAQFNEELRTKVQQATQELARANQRLFEAQRALGQSERLASLGQFASQMAHEIGTPLNSIYGHIQLLAADEISEAARKRITIVESQVERLTKIIENVLRTLRLPDAQLREINVNPTLTGLAAFTQPLAANRKINLELRLRDGMPQVYVDSRQLEQVLLNLFTNALDAMPDGGTLTLESDHTSAEPDDEILIRVRDTGIGIPPENIIKIFEPFFTTKPPGSGTGLGLPVCKQILRVFRGSLSAESEGPGKGSCFTVRLPAVRPTSVSPSGNGEAMAMTDSTSLVGSGSSVTTESAAAVAPDPGSSVTTESTVTTDSSATALEDSQVG